ncbi:patatin-like phospholipase family protein [Eubacterium oxidoreducens]|uniref:Predicted phospholipase, patatin/cPLA2 family n=1 Tax=Eubacterium oxidoreducens TaxID=1732 RepID=A0A1G6A5Q9_EUBOX|nr:patatin family protein [Eubacterium oxidoreducens]SDB03767.1 Predicted phospholipase, patatin/cPLA2 family [Eubacterium oxidoreducens]
MNETYSRINELPCAQATGPLTEGCIVLEGGSFRGLYTGGVLDTLMQHEINLSCTIGVSAGSMNGFNYTSGQIGRASRFNLRYRFNKAYVGRGAKKNNKGVIGFDIVFDDDKNDMEPFNKEVFDDPNRRFVAVVTNCDTGNAEYMEKGSCSDIFQAIRASASMPILSKPVEIDKKPYLDGGCAVAMGLEWALKEGYDKIVVVRTRDRSYRKSPVKGFEAFLQKLFYKRRYPDFYRVWSRAPYRYNILCDKIDQLEQEGRIFVIAPSEEVTVSRLEKDIEKLGDLYMLGKRDTEDNMDKLKEYLTKEEA